MDRAGPSREDPARPQAMEQEGSETIEPFDVESTTYLDGRFFRLDPARSTARDIVGICQFCPDQRPIKGSRHSSSNFNTHLKRQHPEIYQNDYRAYVAEKRQRLSNEALLQAGKKATCLFSQPLFEKNVAEFVLHSMVPFSTVEMPSFRKIFNDMQITRNGVPLKHISRRQLVRNLHIVHNKEMAAVQRALAGVEYVCTTCDVWSSTNRRFLGVTAHWVDPQDYSRKSAAIACRRFAGSHTHERIAELLSSIHEQFNIREKVVATITDNASNFAKAFTAFGIDKDALLPYETVAADAVGDEDASDAASDAGSNASSDAAEVETDDEEEEFSQPDPWEIVEEITPPTSPSLPRHIRCMSHTLNLIATSDFLRLLETDTALKLQHLKTIERCTYLWKLLRSSKQRETLVGILGRSLMRPVVVRWNSLYDSFNQIVQLRDNIRQASATMSIVDPLQETDFEYIDEYLHCFKPIADAIIKLQAENFCYYGCVLPTIVSLRRLISQAAVNRRFKYCQSLPGHIQSSIDKRFSDYLNISGIGEFAAISAVLHPRFKRAWMPSLSPELKSSVDSAVKIAVNSFYERSLSQVREEIVDNDDFFDFGIEEPSTSYATPLGGMPVAEIDLMKYLTERPTNRLSTLHNYPTLKKAFGYYNTPLPSSAAVERLFSYATLISVPKYNRLTDAQFEMRVLAKCNSAMNKT